MMTIMMMNRDDDDDRLTFLDIYRLVNCLSPDDDDNGDDNDEEELELENFI